MSVELKFFAKPGSSGEIFVSLDSLVEFLRDKQNQSPEYATHVPALFALADILEEELGKIRFHQKTIADTFGVRQTS